MATLPVLSVSHGAAVYTAAPADPTHDWLQSLAPGLAAMAPRAVVVVSAHHVTHDHWAVTTAARLRVLHDHPATAWHAERYDPPGDPVLADRVVTALRGAGLDVRTTPDTALDHGAWLPLRGMLPGATVPVVRLSLNATTSIQGHLAVGAALEPLRRDGVLVVASGGVTHNQQAFRTGYFRGASPAQDPPDWSVRFDDWVTRTLTDLDPVGRRAVLADHPAHPDHARSHPTPEHFWPLLVAVGAAGDSPATRAHQGFQHGLSMSAYRFDGLAPGGGLADT